jgi:threonine-phosphate decarboxylase
MIEGHGDDLYRYDADMVRMNFSSNVYPHADHTALKEHLSAHLDMIKHYPEPRTRSLEKLIALKLGLSSESVMVTNGATEAIYLIAQMLHHSASVIPQPTFSEYADACRINHHIISYENTEDLSSLPSDRVYWICNPNNPTGNVMTKGVIEYIVRRSPRYTFVIDQSYEDYTQEELLSPKEVLSCRNLFVLHSLGKKYAMPGLRLGYVTAHPDTLQLLRTFQQPWSVNALAIEAGKFLIKQDKPAIPYLDAYLIETERLRSKLREIEGIRVFETKTNYMLCQIEDHTSTDLKYYLVHEHGILIRDCHNITGLSNHFFRVATQRPDENDALVDAIHQFLNLQNPKE